MSRTIANQSLYNALRDELGIDINNVRRVVIDIQVDALPVVHTEQYAVGDLIHIVRTMKGVEIKHVDRAETRAEAA